MNKSTTRNEFEGPRDRRKRLRRLSDRAAQGLLQVGSKSCCAEVGCEETVLPGHRFCIWHPKLRLGRLTPRECAQA